MTLFSSDIPDDWFEGPFGPERRRMIEQQLLGRDVHDPCVLEAMARVPRHRFVTHDKIDYAYEDSPLSIGHGQTISQPYMVAKMTELLHVRPGCRVLEIGSGCGYQTAVLLELGTRVVALELIEAIEQQAEDRLQELGYEHFEMHCRNGWGGDPEGAPFDAILVGAAPYIIPPALPGQLGPGGRLVLPVGEFEDQRLVRIERRPDGKLDRRDLFPVRFVPLHKPSP